jgi:hypothetical protein
VIPTGGLPYLDFLAPGILAQSATTVGYARVGYRDDDDSARAVAV